MREREFEKRKRGEKKGIVASKRERHFACCWFKYANEKLG